MRANFEPVPYPKAEYGRFHTGDSYIVMNTKGSDKEKFFWDIHFWIGAETTADAKGSAAIYTVQLDESLGGEPIQHREVQHHESHLFLSYFKNGVRYEAGGVHSGFKSVEINAGGTKRLFQVKGKKNIRVYQVKVSISAMNKGDCFILESGKEIFVWIGKYSKRLERLKAMSAANQIRDQDHGGRAKVHIVDELSDKIPAFFKELGSGDPDSVPDASTAEDDAAFEQACDHRTTLYKVSDAGGSLKIDSIAEKPLRQDMLKSGNCYILDTSSGIFVWVGRKATKQEKDESMALGIAFLKSKKYPDWKEVHRIVESGEGAPFKQYFSTWRDIGATHAKLVKEAMDIDVDDEKEVSDETLQTLKKSGGHALGFMPDNGDGKPEIWLVHQGNLTPVAKEAFGIFFGGDAYVMKYEYKNRKGQQGYLIYYWLGQESSDKDKEAALKFATKLNQDCGGKAIQVRIAHGFATRHFLKLFKEMIIFSGGNVSGFKHISNHTEGNILFRVRGTCRDDVRADQLKEVASSLASGDVFILKTPQNTYIWHGEGGSNIEKDMAQTVVKKFIPDAKPVIVEEGKEPAEFWSALGGKNEYNRELDPPGAPILESRMFDCKIVPKSNRIIIEEIVDYEQSDLDEDDIMLIDGGDEVYIWIGSGTTAEEKEKAMFMAKAYLKTDPTERNENTAPIIMIHQSAENPGFKRLFPSWDDNFWKKA